MKLTVKQLKKLLGVSPTSDIDFAYITPAIAEKILAENNDHNRKLRKNDVFALKKQFADGEYFTSTDCIGFDEYGTVVNGQHRLTAISMLQGETHFKIGVMFGVKHEMGMDTGRKRSLKENALLFDDFSGELKKDGAILCVDILKDALTYCRGTYNFRKLSQRQYVDITNHFTNKLIECYNAGIFDKIPGYTPMAVQSAMFIAYCDGVDLDVMKYILNKLKDNSFNGSTDNPILRLMKTLNDIKGGGREPGLKRHLAMQCCIYKVSKKHVSASLTTNKWYYTIKEDIPHIS